jgi:hypothetical protein
MAAMAMLLSKRRKRERERERTKFKDNMKFYIYFKSTPLNQECTYILIGFVCQLIPIWHLQI